MSLTDPAAPGSAAVGPPGSRWLSLSPRARFRARLDRDPRRWVLFLTALGGASTPMIGLTADRSSLTGMGLAPALFTLFLSATAAIAILAMFAHARLVLWTGRLLGGAASTVELHAASAWSQLPVVATSAPLLLELPLRIAAADADPVPAPLQFSLDLAVALSTPLRFVSLAAMVAGIALWLVYLAEAQRFALWRALANELLAAAIALAIGLGLLAAATGIVPSRRESVQFGLAFAGLLVLIGVAALIEWAMKRRSRPA